MDYQNKLAALLQGVSNSAASTISGPIDLINSGLGYLGLPVSSAPFGGSSWMARQGLTAEPQNKLAGLLGEAVGMSSPIVAAAKAPQIAKGLLSAGQSAIESMGPKLSAMAEQRMQNLGGLLGAAPASNLPMDSASRAARMIDQGYSPNYWRGGKSIADGPHYTPDKEAAVAFGARHGPNPDVREYALRLGKTLDFNAGYSTNDLLPIAKILGEKFGNKMAAKELPFLAQDWGGKIPGSALHQVLEAQTGGNAADVLKAAGYNSINAGQEVKMLNELGSGVRDMHKARFDPLQINSLDPMASSGLFSVA